MDVSFLQKLRNTSGLGDEERKRLIIELADIIDEQPEPATELKTCLAGTKDAYERVFICSYLLSVEKKSEWMEELLSSCIDSDMHYLEKYFVYSQVTGLLFKYEDYNSARTWELSDDLYEQIYQGYVTELGALPEAIPAEERNKDFILVMTGQILQIQHGPTKTILDRCRILQKDMGKEILLINLSVMQPLEHVVPMYDISIGSHIEQYGGLEYIDYEDVRIPFVQMSHGFPTVDELLGLIELVKEYKPYQIVSVDDGIVVDVLSLLVPTLVISLTPSELRRTKAQYIQIGRPVNDDDRVKLGRRGKTEDNVITGIFSSRLAPQGSVKSRQELGLPVDAKIAVVIGGRLNFEVTREFLEAVCPCVEKGLYLMFLGDVSQLEAMISEVFDGYTERVICPGTVTDTLMYLDHCYMYLNPIRRGGGTSSVEAMSKGVVPLTTDYGDVYTNVGDEFLVGDYKEMTDMALRLTEDREYYESKSAAARERAARMLDSSSAFISVMDEFEKRMNG